MKDFRRPSGQGADRHAGNFDNRGGYNKYSAERNSGERHEVKHRAICSECNSTCEVPFRPNGSKPVYCKDCFGKKKGAYPNPAEKKEFAPRAPEPVREIRDTRIDDLKAQVFSIQSKLDRILKVVEAAHTPAASKPVEKAMPSVVMQEKKSEKKAVAPAKKRAAVKRVVTPAAKTPAKAKPAAKKKK